MSQDDTRAIVVLSGGQDSTTTLAVAQHTRIIERCVFFDYGQRHLDAEKAAAQQVASHFGVSLEVLPLDGLGQIGGGALVAAGDISDPHPALAHLPSSYVPGRNILFLTLAAALAVKNNATEVWTGVCQTDYSGYPDCREATVRMLEAALRVGMDFPELAIKTPLMYLTKGETFALAEQYGCLELILNVTHTCYEGDNETPNEWGYGCRDCPACQVRARGWADYRKQEKEVVGADTLG